MQLGQWAFGYVEENLRVACLHWIPGRWGLLGHSRFTILKTARFGVTMDHKRNTALFGRDSAFLRLFLVDFYFK
jgi:hypothetical protein